MTTFILHRLTFRVLFFNNNKKKPYGDLAHRKGRRKVITNFFLLLLNLCVCVQSAAQLAITQHHGKLIYLS